MCARAQSGKAYAPELRRQIQHVGGHHVEIARLGIVRLTRGAVFLRPVDESGAQTETARGPQVARMRRAHHHFFRLQLQQAHRGEVGFAIGLVMPGQLGGKDQVPGNTGMLGHVGQKRDVAVRQRRNGVLLLEARETGDGIGPRLQAMPDAVPMVFFFFGKTFDVKFLEQFSSSARCRWSRLVQGISPFRTLSMEGA